MILPFSTQINGKPTYFVEKIQSALAQMGLFKDYNKADFDHKEFCIDVYLFCDSKIHTIRDDKNNRWKPGVMIDYFINCRQPNMFRFAPRIPVVSTQKVFMTYAFNDVIQISVDDRELFSYTERLEFAKNDGEELKLNLVLFVFNFPIIVILSLLFVVDKTSIMLLFLFWL